MKKQNQNILQWQQLRKQQLRKQQQLKTTTKKTATKSPVEIITPDIVGTSAGKIWNTLNGSEEALTEKELLSLTKLSGQSLYLGLGWLAREGKLESDGKEFKLA